MKNGCLFVIAVAIVAVVLFVAAIGAIQWTQQLNSAIEAIP